MHADPAYPPCVSPELFMRSTLFRFLALAAVALAVSVTIWRRPAARAADAPPQPSAPASQPTTTAPAPLLDKDKKPYPPLAELANMSGDPKAGAAVFRNAQGANCVRCHQIGDEGGNV